MTGPGLDLANGQPPDFPTRYGATEREPQRALTDLRIRHGDAYGKHTPNVTR
jgi:hypothetical protein